MRAAVLLICVGVIELFALASQGLVLAHVHWLLWRCACHLTVLLVAGQLVWVDHREHLAETLTDTCNSLCRVSERQLVPGHKLDALTVHVDKSLLA